MLTAFSFTQEFKCGLNEKLAKLYAENPQLQKDHEALFKNGFQEKKVNGEKMVIFTIPIVFHILHYDGIENISDEQVLDAVRIINEDFRLLNSDTSLVVPSFKPIYADVGIEFKLASKDPSGNCTNGIEHIYTHETFQGDDYSKINMWHRSNYLNIWVVDKMENGVAGYSYYPTSVEGNNFFRDGVIILHNYVGSIGTGSVNNSRALTHEIGHYLGLAHPWGSTNEPGVSCGDDGIPDTPITRGSNLVCNLSLSQCTAGVIENVQNFMDYSYCSRMFTADQASAMRNNLQGISGNRDRLITDSTHFITGVDITNPPICKPTAYIQVPVKQICKGESIQFFDRSYNGPVESRTWFFDDGIANSTTSSNPQVVFNTAGYKTIKLVVSNASGSDSVVAYNQIYVSPEWADFTGPTAFDFESASVNQTFQFLNPSSNEGKFEPTYSNGFNNSSCLKLGNYKNVAGALMFTPNYFYYNRLGGSQDAFITPSIDLSNTTNIEVSFQYAYATSAETLTDITENLKVYSSRNCGETWILRKTITSSELLTAGNFSAQPFNPSTNSQWKTASFVYNATNLDSRTRFKFEFTASDFSNNFFIDNININGVLGLTDELAESNFELFPNPVSDELNLTFTEAKMDGMVTIHDATGKIVKSIEVPAGSQHLAVSMTKELQLSNGYYTIAYQVGNHRNNKRFVLIH